MPDVGFCITTVCASQALHRSSASYLTVRILKDLGSLECCSVAASASQSVTDPAPVGCTGVVSLTLSAERPFRVVLRPESCEPSGDWLSLEVGHQQAALVRGGRRPTMLAGARDHFSHSLSCATCGDRTVGEPPWTGMHRHPDCTAPGAPNRIQLILFGMQNRPCRPYLAANNRILMHRHPDCTAASPGTRRPDTPTGRQPARRLAAPSAGRGC
jgi:hypothetical protein